MIHRTIEGREGVFQPNTALFEVERLDFMTCIQTDFSRELIAEFLQQLIFDQYFYLFKEQLIRNCLSKGKNYLINKCNVNVSGLTSQIFSMKGYTSMENTSLFLMCDIIVILASRQENINLQACSHMKYRAFPTEMVFITGFKNVFI